MIGRLAALAGVLLLAAWLTGRIWTDEHLWSQFLWWLPTPLVAAGVLVAVLVSAACEFVGLRLAGARLRPLLVLSLIALVAWWAVFETKFFPASPQATGGPEFSIGYWNLSWAEGSGEAGGPGFAADVLIAANPRPSAGRQELSAALLERQRDAGFVGGEEAVHTVNLLGSTVVSRLPLIEHGVAKPDLDLSAWTAKRNGAFQNGIAYVIVDATELVGRPVCIWIIDAPSDPLMPRTPVMRSISDAAVGWPGPGRVPDELGRWIDRAEPRRGFPAADFIVGDFNATRASASLDALTPGMTESHTVAGRGSGRTFPGILPLWAIDLAFASDDWAWTSSRSLSVTGPHEAIVVRAAIREAVQKEKEPTE